MTARNCTYFKVSELLEKKKKIDIFTKSGEKIELIFGYKNNNLPIFEDARMVIFHDEETVPLDFDYYWERMMEEKYKKVGEGVE
jgi:hypothetical protein